MSKDYTLYHDTYSSAIAEVMSNLEAQGYYPNEDEVFTSITVGRGKPSDGDTIRHDLELYDSRGLPVGKQAHIQIYNRGQDRNTYELNMYISPLRKKDYSYYQESKEKVMREITVTKNIMVEGNLVKTGTKISIQEAGKTAKCPICGTKYLVQTGYCLKCKKKVGGAKKESVDKKITEITLPLRDQTISSLMDQAIERKGADRVCDYIAQTLKNSQYGPMFKEMLIDMIVKGR